MLQLRSQTCILKGCLKARTRARRAHGFVGFGSGFGFAPFALRYASLPLLACLKFGRAWNSEDSEDSEQFQTSTCYQSLEAKNARILNVFFCMTHDTHESTLLYFSVFLCICDVFVSFFIYGPLFRIDSNDSLVNAGLSFEMSPRSAHIAKQLAEPEDQAFHGIGARSARWTLHVVLGLTLCSAPVSTVSVVLKSAKGLRSFSEYFEVGDRFPLLNPSYSVPLEG